MPHRLAGLTGTEGKRVLLDVVRTSAAIVLGHMDSEAVDSARTFKQLGFDSASTVEFCNRLAIATGIPLATTLTFDFPTPELLAAHLLTQVSGGRTSRWRGPGPPRPVRNRSRSWR